MNKELKELEESKRQLEDLKIDRESFIIGDKENDEIYLEDIKAIETVLKELERLQEENKANYQLSTRKMEKQ